MPFFFFFSVDEKIVLFVHGSNNDETSLFPTGLDSSTDTQGSRPILRKIPSPCVIGRWLTVYYTVCTSCVSPVHDEGST